MEYEVHCYDNENYLFAETNFNDNRKAAVSHLMFMLGRKPNTSYTTTFKANLCRYIVKEALL
jgi:hypothetical protein